MSCFLGVGDLHLEKGGRYGRVPGERLAEQEAVWARALGLAREHQVDAVLFAGDAFEKRHPSTDALLAFERPLIQHDGYCPVIAIPGNHDRSGVSEWCALDVFAEAGLIRLASRPAVTTVPASVDDDLSIACLPWAPVSRIVAAHDGDVDRDDVNRLAAELLVETARGLRAQADGPCLLLAHLSISGAALPGGVLTDQLREPVLPAADLEAIGFDAIVAGHIHRAQRFDVKPPHSCPVFYTGSPLPLDFGEGGMEHGVWLLDLDGHDRQTLFLPIESRDFLTIDVDATDPENPGVLEEIAAGDCSMWESIPGAFVKLRYRASAEQARRIDNDALRRGLYEMGAHNVWVEPTIERAVRARVQGIDETVSDTDALDRWIESQPHAFPEARNGLLAALHERHAAYLQEIRS